MTDKSERLSSNIPVLPYYEIKGQESLKVALEISYIAGPRIGGILISGERGTGKTTIVRSFSKMMFDDLPITLPINATEDRVVGGWEIQSIMAGEAKQRKGLLANSDGKMLYVDEINLLDDHIVNIILDTTATGILSVQRQGIDIPAEKTSFILVGTMNPEEGHLRPQLLDRFGLMVNVVTEPERRIDILNAVLKFDLFLSEFDENSPEKTDEYNELHKNQPKKNKLEWAKKELSKIEIHEPVIFKCIELAERFEAVGHRADYILALSARAMAAREAADDINEGKNKIEVTKEHLGAVARMALEHRRKDRKKWSEADDDVVSDILGL